MLRLLSLAPLRSRAATVLLSAAAVAPFRRSVSGNVPSRARLAAGLSRAARPLPPGSLLKTLPAFPFPGPPSAPLPGLYRHSTSGGLYLVLGSVLHTETSEAMVLYRAVEPDEARNPLGMAFVRPADMFTGTMEHEGKTVPRFQRVDSDDSDGWRRMAASSSLRHNLARNGANALVAALQSRASSRISTHGGARLFSTESSPPRARSLQSVFVDPDSDITSSLCSENMRYELLNILQAPVDREHAIIKRRTVYRGLYELIRQNSHSNPKAHNLYALLYSKFYTMRYMVQQDNLRDPEFRRVENDAAIKKEFKALVELVGQGKIRSADELDEEFFSIIVLGRNEHAKKAFERAGALIDGRSEESWERYKGLFFAGADQTTAHLHKKLGKDLDAFRSKKEKILEFLDKYKFINGWITAAGIGGGGILLGIAKLSG